MVNTCILHSKINTFFLEWQQIEDIEPEMSSETGILLLL